MQNNKLINAIERALQKKLNYAYMTCSYLPEISEIATEIYTAIAPIVAEKDLPLSELFTHMSEQHDLTLTDTELADIIQVSRNK